MKGNKWILIFMITSLYLLSFFSSGCRVVKTGTWAVHYDSCSYQMRQSWMIVDCKLEDTCRVLFGFQIPQAWELVSFDTFAIEGDLYSVHEDIAVTDTLISRYPPVPGYKWVGFATDDSISSTLYPDSVTGEVVYRINRHLPAGPASDTVYERVTDECGGWGDSYDFEFMLYRDIPTLTEWGLIIFGVVLLGFISWVFLKRRRRAVVSY